MKSLQWLRGWVQPIAVQREFRQLGEFSESIRTCANCQLKALECTHMKTSYWTKVKSMTKSHIQKPFILCCLMEFFVQFSLLLSFRPYLIQIFKAYGIQTNANVVAVYMTVIANVACLCLTFIIKFTGKRPVVLCSAAACAALTYLLGDYELIQWFW